MRASCILSSPSMSRPAMEVDVDVDVDVRDDELRAPSPTEATPAPASPASPSVRSFCFRLRTPSTVAESRERGIGFKRSNVRMSGDSYMRTERAMERNGEREVERERGRENSHAHRPTFHPGQIRFRVSRPRGVSPVVPLWHPSVTTRRSAANEFDAHSVLPKRCTRASHHKRGMYMQAASARQRKTCTITRPKGIVIASSWRTRQRHLQTPCDLLLHDTVCYMPHKRGSSTCTHVHVCPAEAPSF